MTDSSKSVP
jgi:hypothetical protein